MRVEITNFRAHRSACFDFSPRELTLISGPSGIGKSTVFQAILWCLYGKMNKVQSKGSKEQTCVTVTFQDGTEVTRAKPPESLSVTYGGVSYTSVEAQSLIVQLYGSRNLFTSSSYLCQGERSVLTQLPGIEKFKLLHEYVYGCEEAGGNPDEYREKAKTKNAEAKRELLQKTAICSALESEYTDEVKKFNQEYPNWSKVQNMIVSKQCLRFNVELSSLTPEEVPDALDRVIEGYRQDVETVKTLSRETENVARRINDVERNLEDKKAKLFLLESKLVDLDPIEEKIKLTEIDVTAAKEAFSKASSELQLAMSRDITVKEELTKAVKTSKTKLDASIDRLKRLNEEELRVKTNIGILKDRALQTRGLLTNTHVLEKHLSQDLEVQKELSIVNAEIDCHVLIGIQVGGYSGCPKQIINSEIDKCTQELSSVSSEMERYETYEEDLNKYNEWKVRMSAYNTRKLLHEERMEAYARNKKEYEELLKEHEKHHLKWEEESKEYDISLENYNSKKKGVEAYLVKIFGRVMTYEEVCKALSSQKVSVQCPRCNGHVIHTGDGLIEADDPEVIKKRSNDLNITKLGWEQLTQLKQAVDSKKPGPEPVFTAKCCIPPEPFVLVAPHKVAQPVKAPKELESKKYQLTSRLKTLNSLTVPKRTKSELIDEKSSLMNVHGYRRLLGSINTIEDTLEEKEGELKSLSKQLSRADEESNRFLTEHEEAVLSLNALDTTHVDKLRVIHVKKQGELQVVTSKHKDLTRDLSECKLGHDRVLKMKDDILKMEEVLFTLSKQSDQLGVQIKSFKSLHELVSSINSAIKASKVYRQYLVMARDVKRLTEMSAKVSSLKAETANVAAYSSSLEKIITVINKVSSESMQALIYNINSVIKAVADEIFDEPIFIELSTKKTLKDGDTRLSVNTSVTYKDVTHSKLHTLSGGEQDRVSLALTIALASHSTSPLLLLDECMASLNSELRDKCIEALRKHLPNKIVIHVCHEIVKGTHDRVIDMCC